MTEKKIPSIYRTKEEWAELCKTPEYKPNLEITDDNYDRDLAAKCENGVFVGKYEDDVKTWKGIPFARQPVGEYRFRQAEAPEPSDKVYEAYYYMKSGMQAIDPDECGSLYEQGEENLGLNIWNSSASDDKKKPVMVFIHGGGFMAGGPSDYTYNGFYFAHYNPDVIMVTVTYRLGMFGQINLDSFPDGDEYPTSRYNCVYDLVQALKWIKNNIAAFGGDPDNITISGESAGGGFTSLLCVFPPAKGLFQKAFPMSGAVSLYNGIEETDRQIKALREEFGCKTVKDLEQIPFETLRKWWVIYEEEIYHHPVRDGRDIPVDPFELWEKGNSKDLIIMQGHTECEYKYFQAVFGGLEEMYDASCQGMMERNLKEGSEEFLEAFGRYEKALNKLGFEGKEVARRYMDDVTLNIGNTYQAIQHAKNGGKGYSYTFEKGFDGKWEYMGAAHAADLAYFFGSFDGDMNSGTPEEVELCRKYQEMVANFCKTGDPSTEDIKWPEYDGENRRKLMIGDNMRVEENPEGERVDIALELMGLSDRFRFMSNESELMEAAAEINPEAAAKWSEIWMERQE